jgi:ribosomal protein S18 acetylase RimI-like enzyme
MNNFLQLRQLVNNNVNEMVNIHSKAFEGFFLTSLGPNFLKTYYRSCIKNELTISVGVFDENNKLCGFAIGASNSSGYHKRILLSNFYRFANSLINVAVFRPRILIRLLLNLNKSNKKEEQKNKSELFSIAVLPNFKGIGLGYKLLSHFESIVKDLGVNTILLTTDSENNQDVLNFYAKNGYSIYYDFITYPNRKMYKLIKNL